VDSSFLGKAWARSSEAMQIKKHTTLTSNRFRFVRLTAKNSLVAMLRVQQASTYQRDPTDVVGNPLLSG
jgi:hypothetical protein